MEEELEEQNIVDFEKVEKIKKDLPSDEIIFDMA